MRYFAPTVKKPFIAGGTSNRLTKPEFVPCWAGILRFGGPRRFTFRPGTWPIGRANSVSPPALSSRGSGCTVPSPISFSWRCSRLSQQAELLARAAARLQRINHVENAERHSRYSRSQANSQRSAREHQLFVVFRCPLDVLYSQAALTTGDALCVTRVLVVNPERFVDQAQPIQRKETVPHQAFIAIFFTGKFRIGKLAKKVGAQHGPAFGNLNKAILLLERRHFLHFKPLADDLAILVLAEAANPEVFVGIS